MFFAPGEMDCRIYDFIPTASGEDSADSEGEIRVVNIQYSVGLCTRLPRILPVISRTGRSKARQRETVFGVPTIPIHQ
jgi:hypothetical protein